MKRNEKKFVLTSVLVTAMLLLLPQCDKYTPLEFLTENNFVLDSSSHEFDVKTKQGTAIFAITMNGNSFDIPDNIGYQGIDSIKNYDDYSIIYSRTGYFMGIIIGEWFNITTPDKYTTHLLIGENKEEERSLIIKIGSDRVFSDDINIRQKGKGN